MKIDWKQTLWNNPRLWILALILAISLSGRATAQGMPVYDNTNFVSLVKTLVESAKQTTQLLKTVEYLKHQKENLEQVNSVIRQLKAVREIGNNNSRLIKVMQNELRSILSSPYIKPEEVTLYKFFQSDC